MPEPGHGTPRRSDALSSSIVRTSGRLCIARASDLHDAVGWAALAVLAATAAIRDGGDNEGDDRVGPRPADSEL
jgi:hypothetical protein